MSKRNWFLGALVATGALFGATGAQAAFLLDDWSFHASGVDGLPASPIYDIDNIDAWTFVAHFQQNIVDDNGNFVPDVGEHGVVNGVGAITSMLNNDTGILPNPLLNLNPSPFPGLPGYEVSFSFSVDYTITAADATDANFVHNGPTNTDGLLHIFVDNLGDGSQCTPGGLNCTDGVEVATFRILPGDGGAFVIATIDGSDDATFEAIFLASGVWFDEFGNDLACNDAVLGSECNGDPIAMTDSNIDSDPDGDGLLNTDSDLFDCGIDPNTGVSAPIRTCGSEDGSLILASVPEPASLAVFAIGLLMLGTLVGTLRPRAN